MLRNVLATTTLTLAALAAPAAHAGVQWSIGIHVPAPVAVVSGGYVVQPAPVYVAPPPVRQLPAPVYTPAPVYEAPVAYAPAPVYSAYPAWRVSPRERWERAEWERRMRREREWRHHHHRDGDRRW